MLLWLIQIIGLLTGMFTLIKFILGYYRYINLKGYFIIFPVKNLSKPDENMRELLKNLVHVYTEYYYQRSEIESELTRILEKHRKVLLVGRAKSGKTRMILEILARGSNDVFKGATIFIPEPSININYIQIPRRFGLLKWRHSVIFFDNIDMHIRNGVNIKTVISKFNKASKKLTVIMTCRLEEINKIRISELVTDAEILYLRDISHEEAIKIAKKLHDEGIKVNIKDFDGTIGSFILGISEKKEYYSNVSEPEKCIMRAVKLLHMSGIYAPHLSLLKNIWLKIFHMHERDWFTSLGNIKNLGLLRIHNDNAYCHDAYLDIIDFPSYRGEEVEYMVKLIPLLKERDHLYSLGRTLLEKGKIKEAEDCFTRGIKLHPRYAPMYQGRSLVYFLLNKYEEFYTDFEKGLSLLEKDLRLSYIHRVLDMLTKSDTRQKIPSKLLEKLFKLALLEASSPHARAEIKKFYGKSIKLKIYSFDNVKDFIKFKYYLNEMLSDTYGKKANFELRYHYTIKIDLHGKTVLGDEELHTLSLNGKCFGLLWAKYLDEHFITIDYLLTGSISLSKVDIPEAIAKAMVKLAGFPYFYHWEVPLSSIYLLIDAGQVPGLISKINSFKEAYRDEYPNIIAEILVSGISFKVRRKLDELEEFYNLYSQGLSYIQHGRLEEAVKNLKKALKINPTNDEVWYNLGIACIKLKKIIEGIFYLTVACNLAPDKYKEIANTLKEVELNLKEFELRRRKRYIKDRDTTL